MLSGTDDDYGHIKVQVILTWNSIEGQQDEIILLFAFNLAF